MNDKNAILNAADKLSTVKALVKTASMAAENKDHFVEDGPNIAAVLEIAISELRECRKILETALRGHHCMQDRNQEAPGTAGSRIVFGKPAENLVEIALAFSGLAHGGMDQLLESYESVEWAENFTEWANNFEELHSTADWDSGEDGDYYEEIEAFARAKILEAAGMDAG